jgi:hypothetical protein
MSKEPVLTCWPPEVVPRLSHKCRNGPGVHVDGVVAPETNCARGKKAPQADGAPQIAIASRKLASPDRRGKPATRR